MAHTTFSERVAANVRAEMARSGTSQEVLSSKLFRSQSWLSRRLNGFASFQTRDLDDIATALGTKVDVLIADQAAVAS